MPKPSLQPGHVIGRLTVVRKVKPPPGRRRSWYLWRCECGGSVVRSLESVRKVDASGSTASCGCLRMKAWGGGRRRTLLEGRYAAGVDDIDGALDELGGGGW